MNEEVDIIAHRAGWTRPELNQGKEQNSIPRARETLSQATGCEIDVSFTGDGVAVITHDDVSKLTFEQFQEKHPNHATLESWVEWFKTPELAEKKLYLDLKGTGQDPMRLLEMVADLGERIMVGSQFPDQVFKLLWARKLLQTDTKIYHQIPDPLHPTVSVNYANNLAKHVGLNPETLPQEASGLRADGLHFYWQDNVLKEQIAEKLKHGEFHPPSDKYKSETSIPFPNFPGGIQSQLARLRSFVSKAQEQGYEVLPGSTGSADTVERMLSWGLNTTMPNNPEHLPPEVKAKLPPKKFIPPPQNQALHKTNLTEGNLRQELKEAKRNPQTADTTRLRYLELAAPLRGVNFIRRLFGF